MQLVLDNLVDICRPNDVWGHDEPPIWFRILPHGVANRLSNHAFKRTGFTLGGRFYSESCRVARNVVTLDLVGLSNLKSVTFLPVHPPFYGGGISQNCVV